ncbi:hypothetical protein EA848_23010 [Vibrio anguillarum]|nr:hypothetical protein [Vibrio anguillarum]
MAQRPALYKRVRFVFLFPLKIFIFVQHGSKYQHMPPENQIKHHNECGNLPKRVHKEVFIIPIMLNGRVSYQK